jgi:hypothetical protein
MMILYIYRLVDGLFMYEDAGSTSGIINDLGEDKDFTLIPPPDSEHQWRWIDNKWTTDDTAN